MESEVELRGAKVGAAEGHSAVKAPRGRAFRIPPVRMPVLLQIFQLADSAPEDGTGLSRQRIELMR